MHITEEHNPCLPYLRDKTSKLTEKPGCYIMKDSGGKIIYVGKAKNLKHRVTSYFRKGQDHLPKVWKMVSLVRDYDFIVTDSEFEALVLECSLIKQYSPKYNILLKDDKGYSYIRVSNEEYPRLTAALQKEDDGAQYIGPYISSYSVKQAVDEANRVFMLPTCTKQFPRDLGKSRPCLNCFIKQCMGVCKGEISAEDYRGVVQQAVEYIKSGSQASVERLTEQMNAAAEALDFEQAAKLRDRIAAIKKAAEGQKIVSDDLRDMDIFAVSENADRACGSVLMYRGGRLFDKYSAPLGMTDLGSAMREGFITEFYSARSEIPKDILLDEPIENTELLERYLSDKCGHRVHISVPQRGALLRLTTLAKSNASEHLSLRVGRTGKEITALEELAKALGLEKPPRFIECYDISNFGSSDMTCGMVVYENGRPCKRFYRKFAIKTVHEQNDYACMCEAVERRFKRYLDGEDEGFSTLPDLILLDGGKGHVATVTPVVRALGINVPIYGLVKDSKHRTRAATASDHEISLTSYRRAFALVTAIQDEVHRYAITFTKARHKKNSFALGLTSVKGIGEKKAQKLMTEYKTRAALEAATEYELAKTAGVSAATAAELYKYIHGED
ncbi:excinuclease ABC subunit UvrC [Ruminococcus sp. 210702-SL.1.03]|uniref:excinuclease ABC subunit UvrC n=1 Tax=Ruminococcus sp. 210702-SL.1.03 TaxID=2883233 RepID=UPI001D0907C5|nr:excinuclease ABC subunit UvrC [Ruminococcus sp. 210702-SL.1.03]MCB6615894.1 excinuclease ABC subunit UvrC [Ruminococcus sp. 210702-SL.1.03]